MTKAGAHLAGETQLLEAASDDYLKGHAKDAPGALVIADRDAGGAAIAKAASWVNGLPDVMVAVRDASGAPELVALGHSDLTHRSPEAGPGITIDATGLHGCGQSDRKSTVTVSITGGTGADLAAAVAAARQQGLERFVVDGAACP